MHKSLNKHFQHIIGHIKYKYVSIYGGGDNINANISLPKNFDKNTATTSSCYNWENAGSVSKKYI